MEWNRQLAADQERIEAELIEYAAAWPAYGRQREAMSYSLMSGGKRIRPVLVLETCRLFGGSIEAALPLACGLEMIHTYSLIHDDLPCMDDDDLRRGKPTNHKVFGEASAVLAGDGLLTAAFEAVAGAELPPERVVRAVRALAAAAGPAGMVGGQVLDLLGEGHSLSREEIVQIETLKTGCLLEAAARLGAIAAGSTRAQEEAAAEYARGVGLAFQIRDDVLDVLGDEAEFGKPIGSDAASGKATFVSLCGLDVCEDLIAEHTRRAIAAVERFPNSGFLCDLARTLAGRTK